MTCLCKVLILTTVDIMVGKEFGLVGHDHACLSMSVFIGKADIQARYSHQGIGTAHEHLSL